MARILILSPHPDDEAIGCGGTLRQRVLGGDDVRVVFLTSGEGGGHGRSPQETVVVREAEAGAAARILGYEHLEFWHEPDGQLAASPTAAPRLRSLLETWRPDEIFVPHEAEMHGDHRAAADLVRVVVSAMPANARPVIWMYEVWTPLQSLDEITDITSVVADKLAAIRAHASQCAVLSFDDAVLGLNRYRGEMHCWPEGEYAEVFARMHL